jgi:ribosome-associated protein
MTSFELGALAANLADDKKAKDILVLDTERVSCIADYFVLCSGESSTQIRTIADTIEKEFKALGTETLGRERDQSGQWHLLDYGDIVIHVMTPQAREFYQLEQFWNHANVVPRASWQRPSRQAS